MSDILADIRFLTPTTISVTVDGEEFEEEDYEEGDEEKEIIIIEESDNMVTLQYGDGSVGVVERSAFEIIHEY
jgi:hypothetical protein